MEYSFLGLIICSLTSTDGTGWYCETPSYVKSITSCDAILHSICPSIPGIVEIEIEGLGTGDPSVYCTGYPACDGAKITLN